MKLLFYLIALFTFSISACTTKNHKISQINIKGLDLLNADKKTDVVVEIPNNDTISIIKAKIKIRGGSSIGYDKKNFSLTLKDKFTFNGFHRDKNFVLGASVIDKTFLRNVFCYHFFREWNINNIAPHTSYTELYLDNTYYGFYVLTEKTPCL